METRGSDANAALANCPRHRLRAADFVDPADNATSDSALAQWVQAAQQSGVSSSSVSGLDEARITAAVAM
jgi:hypothetical protein